MYLTFKQYGFNYDLPANIHHIPVGYLPGVHIGGVPDFETIIPPKQRQYDWAFIGGLKSDRQYAINTFKTLYGNTAFISSEKRHRKKWGTYTKILDL